MKTSEDKRMVKLYFFENCPFWTYIKKNQDIHFGCMVIPLNPHSVYTL